MIVVNSDTYVNSYWMINGVIECCKLENVKNHNLDEKEIKDIYEETFSKLENNKNKLKEENEIWNVGSYSRKGNNKKNTKKYMYRNDRKGGIYGKRANMIMDPFSSK
jgi:hypothetical protein